LLSQALSYTAGEVEELQTTKADTTITTSWNGTQGQLNLNGAVGNYIMWASTGAAGPTSNTRSIGTKLVLYTSLSPVATDYAIGVDSSVLWYSTSISNGTHRWYLGTTQGMNLSLAGLVVAGNIYTAQGASTTLTATGTLSIAAILGGMVLVTSATFVGITLPSGASTHAGMIGGSSSTLAINQSLDWTIINTGSSAGSITVLEGSGAGVVGSMVVPINTSARFRTRLGSTNQTYTYRLS
jgi:hypothetical protein